MKLLKSLVLLLSLVNMPTLARSDEPLVLFAAASLKNVVDALIDTYGDQSGTQFKPVYAASSTLARQIEAGAPANIFVSANQSWIDYLLERNLADAASVVPIATNSLIIIVPRDDEPFELIEIRDRLKNERIVIADPSHVPAGVYARQALENLNVWSDIKDGTIRAANVRDALAYVARDEVSLGIVYSSDALVDNKVYKIYDLSTDLHEPILYKAAITVRSQSNQAAREFLSFLSSDESRAIFAKHGFGPGSQGH